MKTIKDVLKETKSNHRKVEICEVVDCVLNTLLLLDRESGNFKEVATKLPKGYNGIINTLTFSLIANIATLGLDENEVYEYFRDLGGKDIKGVKAFAFVKKEGD